ncbi:hypothetical protein ScPMuIL_013974 [Solemya velum]
MKTLIVFSLLLAVTAADVKDDCPDGWFRYGYSCYKFVAEDVTYDKAVRRCWEMGSDIVRIEDQAENDFIHDMVNGTSPHWWIGLSDKNEEHHHVWEDCPLEHTHFVHWADGEPNNHDEEEEDCTQMVHSTGFWNDVPCDKTLNYVCEIRSYDVVLCSSWRYRHKKCHTNYDLPVRDLCMLSKKSRAPCVWDYSYFLGDDISMPTDDTVFSCDKGCRAWFIVYF